MRIPPLPLVAFAILPVFPLDGDPINYDGDVTDLRVLRHVDQHPDSWRIWQPAIVQWKKNYLIVAYGAMTNGKKDSFVLFRSTAVVAWTRTRW